MNDEFGGRSLYFVRRLVGLPAQFASAKEAADHLLLMQDAPPEVGSVVFYRSEPYGNCGLYVGRQLAITVHWSGDPVLYRVDKSEDWGGPYLGWCPAQDLARDAS